MLLCGEPTDFMFFPQNRPPQHQWRQLRLPLGGRGELLGQAGPSHLPAETLHDGPQLVERGRREDLAEAIPEDGDGGFREGRETPEAKSWIDVYWRVPGGDAPSEQAERFHVEARAAVQRALPAWPVW